MHHETMARRQTALRARIQHSAIRSGDRRFTWNGPYLPLEDDPMSKPVNDVRASSFNVTVWTVDGRHQHRTVMS